MIFWPSTKRKKERKKEIELRTFLSAENDQLSRYVYI